jgi:acetolactate synthase-1/2/3 large subunit
MKYAEYLVNKLASEENYTHCYFVAGGNTMHLLDAARKVFKCIPVINEVAAGIATEYFNESNTRGNKAFALVTAGPGLTNIVTAIAGAYLESRELLVIGGQVKSSNLKSSELRQRGIQEIDGRAIAQPITVASETLLEQIPFSKIQEILHTSIKPGPVFLEIPLDVQGSELIIEDKKNYFKSHKLPESNKEEIFLNSLLDQLSVSERPILLLGGGLSRKVAKNLAKDIEKLGIPIMTTWNGMDRYGDDLINYWGRPNTWGQRSSNILIQQCDLLIAIGTRLGLQQTGFAWEDFAPLARIYQIDIDKAELEKGHPIIEAGLQADAGNFLINFINSKSIRQTNYSKWLEFGKLVLYAWPLNDIKNETSPGYISPYVFMETLSAKLQSNDVVVPCSSGGAFTVAMQAFVPKFGQIIVTNKGLASMGYGLSGAIGAAESTKSRTILVEGDGGFAQNLQELGTLAVQQLNVKIFMFSNSGYASIKMTQRNYFNGEYLGCDLETGLGLPDWSYIAKAYGLRYSKLEKSEQIDSIMEEVLARDEPELIEVKIDPEQTYYPKITSRIMPSGTMASNPLHLMSPALSSEDIEKYLPYLKSRIQKQL